MKRLLLLVLLIIMGCDFPEDCAGVVGGTAELDNCNVCDSDLSNDCVQDCTGQWGGNAIYDICGICGGDGIEEACECTDTSGFNTDDCCDDVVRGCDGVCGSGLINDICGICGGDGIEEVCECTDTSGFNTDGCCDDVLRGCDSVCGSGLINDICGVCGGEGIEEACECIDTSGLNDSGCCDEALMDCAGICDGMATYDDCVTINDIDGNIYQTVLIGNQLWMAENLKVNHYNNGDEIPTGYTGEDWIALTTGAYAVYNNDLFNVEIYGNLYNAYAVDDDRGICALGWHVPSDEEFMELEMFIGMSEEEANSFGERGTNEGSKLAGNADLWLDGDLINNSEFGMSEFAMLPAGMCPHSDGVYTNQRITAYYWSSSEHETNEYQNFYRNVTKDLTSVSRYTPYKAMGCSIRCLAD